MTPSNTTKLILAFAAVFLIVLLPGPVAAQTAEQPVLGRYSESHALRLGVSAGPDFFSSTTGFRVQGDAQYTLFEVAPQLYFDLAGQVAGVFASGVTILELVPKARLRYTLLDPLSLYADAGLGFAFTSLSLNGGSSTQGNGNLRFAGGLQYKFTPKWSVILEPVGLNIYFGNAAAFHYSILAGFLFRVM
jgi:hypothetical protein